MNQPILFVVKTINFLRQFCRLKRMGRKEQAFSFFTRLLCATLALMMAAPMTMLAHQCNDSTCSGLCGGDNGNGDDNQNDDELDPVHMGRFSVFLESPDLQSITEPGDTHSATLAFGRFYSSDAIVNSSTYHGPLGWNWTHNYNVTLQPIMGWISVTVTNVNCVTEYPEDHETVVCTTNYSSAWSESGVAGVTIYTWDLSQKTYYFNNDVIISRYEPPTTGGFMIPHYTGTSDGSTISTNSIGYVWRLKHGTSYQFDAANGNRLASITDRQGTTVTLHYTGAQLTSVTDGAGRQLSLGYDGDNINQMTDPLGRTDTYGYDGSGELTSVADDMGTKTTYGYDGSGRVETITNARGKTHTYVYDGVGKVMEEDNAAGATQLYNRNDATRSVVITDWNGNQVTNVNDENGFLIRRSDAAGKVQWTRDGNGQPTQKLDRMGNYSRYAYDSGGGVGGCGCNPAGKMTMAIDPLERTNLWAYEANFNFMTAFTNAAGHATHWLYDARGNVTNRTDALGHVTRFTYDAAGNRTAVIADNLFLGRYTNTFAYDQYGNLTNATDPLGHGTRLRYDLVGRLTNVMDALNDSYSFTYDARNRLTRLIDPLENTNSWGHDEDGNMTAWTNALGFASAYTYDDVNRLTSITLPESASAFKTFAYDANGNRTAVTDALGNATLPGYDALNRLVAVTNALGNVWNYSHDPNGDLTGLQDPNQNAWSLGYDAAGQLTSVTNPLSQVVRMNYDLVGNLTNIMDANGNEVRYDHDAVNRLTGIDYPAGSEQFNYDAAGRLMSRIRPSGQWDSFGYDNAGRLTTFMRADGSSDYLSYDAAGRVRTVESYIGVDFFWNLMSYDAAGRVAYETEEVNYNAHIIGYSYDAAGHRTKLTYPDGSFVTYNYNSNGWLTNIVDGATGNPIVSYDYDAAGRRVKRTLENSTFTIYDYDNANQVTNIWHQRTGGGTISRDQYGYDGAGNRLWVKRADGRGDAYNYDGINQLTNVLYDAAGVDSAPSGWTNAVGYNFDGAGNRLSVTDTNGTASYQVNAMNQYTNAGGVAVGYDDDGNLNGDGQWTYSYDTDNRLAEADSLTRDLIVTYNYDGFGRLVERDEWQGDGVFLGGRQYYYAGWQMIAEYEDNGDNDALAAKYVYGPGIDEPVRMTQGGTNYYYDADATASVTELTDGRGYTVEQYSYDVYGTPTIKNSGGTVLTTSAIGNKMMFQGRDIDPDTGIYNYRSRNYDPTLGRFMQMDPIGQRGGLNMYEFVGNNPINYIDPLGLSFWSSFGNGLVNGLVSAAVIVGTAAVIVALAPEAAAVVTGALAVGAIVGGASAVISVINNPSADNVGYNVGALIGAAIVGGASGRTFSEELSPPENQPAPGWAGWNPLNDAQQTWDYDSSLSFLDNWDNAMATGPNPLSAAGAIDLFGTGLADIFGDNGDGCPQ